MKIRSTEIYAIQQNICEKNDQTMKCLESVIKTIQGLRTFRLECEEDMNDVKHAIEKMKKSEKEWNSMFLDIKKMEMTKTNENYNQQLIELKHKNELMEQSITDMRNQITTEIKQCEKNFFKENATQENLKLKENMKILQSNIVKIQERTIKLANEITIAENNPFIILLRAQNSLVDEKLLMFQNHLKRNTKNNFCKKRGKK